MAQGRPLPPLRAALLAGALGAALKLALALPFLGRYGWDRDELYFLQASEHLSLGYVDFPPLTALVGRLVVVSFASSLVALRLTGVVAGMLAVVLVSLCVRELGGSFREQLAGSLLFTLTPFGLGLGVLFHPTMLDVPVWLGFSYVALRVLWRPEPRLLPLLGLIAGVGFETKSTVVVLLVVFLAALAVLGPRELFGDARSWIGAGLALLLTLPYVAWQVRHGWPSWEFLQTQAAKTADDTSRPAYVGQQIAFLAGALPVVIAGVVALWRRPRLRALAVLLPVTSLVFFVEQGRSYYALPAAGLPLAAGVVASARWLRASRRHRALAIPVVIAHVVALAVVAPLVWPVLPEHTMVARGVWNDTFYKDELGWPELAQQTATAWRALGPAERDDTAVLAQNYGEAGALALYGPRLGLPRPLSGHLSFQYWRPTRLPQHRLLAVGFARSDLARLCTSWTIVARIENRWRIANEERGRSIARCTLRGTLGDVWATRIASDRL